MTENQSLWSTDFDESNDEAFCRVCHGESEEQRPLFHPCKCDGSIKFVHNDCLLEWLRVSKKPDAKCELCGEKFSFRLVYADNAPSRLSIFEFLCGVAPRAGHVLGEILSGAFFIIIWMICLPLFSSWWMDHCTTYLLTGSFSWNFDLFSSLSLELISLWWNGIVLLACILLLSMGIFQLSTYIYEVGVRYFLIDVMMVCVL
jgi:E3 ubiquitin-protein ligase MARCH6